MEVTKTLMIAAGMFLDIRNCETSQGQGKDECSSGPQTAVKVHPTGPKEWFLDRSVHRAQT